MTQRIVTATIWDNVTLKCELTKSKDVLQVTWQKQNGQSAENIATYNNRFGAKVSDSYRERVSFVVKGLHESSIAIRGVSREDEACYNCLFNSYPEGAIKGITCIATVYGNTLQNKSAELHEPLFEVSTMPAHGSEHRVYLLTCSVTGRPVPTVSWSTERHDVIEDSQQFTVTNPNGTVTVVINATINVSRLTDKETLIKCTVHNSAFGREKEISRVIRNDIYVKPDVTQHQVPVICAFSCFFVLICALAYYGNRSN
ncbi:OX-2 membrane glycoprotein [Amia ocellicauda]|uniref:OX-2 membrane glycoprotein n=1 Tax=Amia ocellicauda TaxID=2972642 RepID=UPI003463ECB4